MYRYVVPGFCIDLRERLSAGRDHEDGAHDDAAHPRALQTIGSLNLRL